MKISREKLRKFRILSELGALVKRANEKALSWLVKDYEDALHYFGATESEFEIIIIRNAKDFKQSLLPIMTTKKFLSSLIEK